LYQAYSPEGEEELKSALQASLAIDPGGTFRDLVLKIRQCQVRVGKGEDEDQLRRQLQLQGDFQTLGKLVFERLRRLGSNQKLKGTPIEWYARIHADTGYTSFRYGYIENAGETA
jgi:hypothetical protein